MDETFVDRRVEDGTDVGKLASNNASSASAGDRLKNLVKAFLNGLAKLSVLPIATLYCISAAAISKERVFPGFSQLISLLPGLTGQYLRRAFYQLVLPQCGKDVCIAFGTQLSHPTATLGARTYVGSHCMLGDIDLAEDVLIGSNVSIINGNAQHGIERLDIPVREQPGHFPRITVGADSWIGDRAIVMAEIGKHCVVGAGSVVTKPVPNYAIVVGNPAKAIGDRRSMRTSQTHSQAAASVALRPVERKNH